MKITQPFNVGQAPSSNNTSAMSGFMRSLIGILRNHNQALTGNLDLTDNIIGQFNTVEIKTLPTYANTSGNVFQPIVIPWQFANNRAPNTVLIGNVVQPSSQKTILTNGHSANWIYNPETGAITINYITGLFANGKFTVTMEIK
jgi:hypothetical protein